MPFYCVRLSIAYRHIKRERFSLKAKFMNREDCLKNSKLCPVLPKSFQWANLNWFSNKSFLFPVDAISLITALKKINQTMQLKICSCISEPVILDTFFWIFISITSARIGRPGPPSASHNKEIMFVLKYQMSAYSCTGTNQLFCG